MSDATGNLSCSLWPHTTAFSLRACGFCYPEISHRRPVSSVLPTRTGHSCAYCGVELVRYSNGRVARDSHTVDHVRPKSRGGSDDPSNKVHCCHRCNQYKADMLLDEWKPELRAEDLVTLADEEAGRLAPTT